MFVQIPKYQLQTAQADVTNRAGHGQSISKGMDEDDDEDDEERQAREAKEAAALLEQEATQKDCDFCRKPLVQPVRLTKCRCALCACCVEVTVRYMRECPVCDTPVDVKGGKVVSDASPELLAQLEERAKSSDCGTDGQLALLQQLVDVRQESQRLVLQYGNTSSGSGSKRTYTTFFKVVSAEGGVSEKGSVLKVDFNINPGYAKPTSTAKEPNNKLGFTFEYAMARAYPCHMTVHFTSSGSGSKRTYTTFFKVVSAEGGVSEKGSVLKVDFNINPGYAKPTSTAKEPNNKLGFTFEYAMARAYPCHMTVHFKPELGLPKLVIEHYVRDEAKTCRRILLQLRGMQSLRHAVDFKGRVGRQHVWMRTKSFIDLLNIMKFYVFTLICVESLRIWPCP